MWGLKSVVNTVPGCGHDTPCYSGSVVFGSTMEKWLWCKLIYLHSSHLTLWATWHCGQAHINLNHDYILHHRYNLVWPYGYNLDIRLSQQTLWNVTAVPNDQFCSTFKTLTVKIWQLLVQTHSMCYKNVHFITQKACLICGTKPTCNYSRGTKVSVVTSWCLRKTRSINDGQPGFPRKWCKQSSWLLSTTHPWKSGLLTDIWYQAQELPVLIADAKTMLSFSTLHKLVHKKMACLRWLTVSEPHSKILKFHDFQHLNANSGLFGAWTIKRRISGFRTRGNPGRQPEMHTQ